MRCHDGLSGHLFEEATLGLCPAESHGYMPWQEAAEQVRKHQPREKRPAAARLEQEVARRLGKFGTAVRFYTAVRSTLDQYHGVDGFFQLGRFVVTIDVTINPEKSAGRADLIIQADDFENLHVLAARIVRELARKIKERVH